MILASITFYMFAGITILSSFMVIFSRNPVHSVLFLILAFINVAGLFILLGAEFLAMILIIVYVGAVAVLFMFVVMMLNMNLARVQEGVLHYLPTGGMIAAVLLTELIFVLITSQEFPEPTSALPSQFSTDVNNTEALGNLLYTKYFYLFQVSGIILLVAMIGAIVLTLRERDGVLRQKISRQVQRRREDSVELRKVPPRSDI